MKKRALTVICLIAAAIALIASETFAFFTVERTATNVITAGEIGFEIIEKTDDGEDFPFEGVTVIPGDTVTKKVTVKNTGEHPIYVRIKLEKGIIDSQLPVADQLKITDLNETDWTEQGGYYYYNTPVEAGAETKPLFTTVELDGPSVGNEYIGKTFYLTVNGQAVQSENNGTDVFTATGWDDGADD